jgi:hypothetical protein
MHTLPEQVLLIAAQSWHAAPLFPHAVCDVPAMHRSFMQHPFAHDTASQSAAAPPTPPPPVLALLEVAPPLPDVAPPLPDVAPLPAPVLAPLLPDVPPAPELAAPLPLALSVPLVASKSISLPSAHAASATATTPMVVMNR